MSRKKSTLNKRNTKKNANRRQSVQRLLGKVQDNIAMTNLQMNAGEIDLQINIDVHHVMSMVLSRVSRLESERKRKSCFLKNQREKEILIKKKRTRIIIYINMM